MKQLVDHVYFSPDGQWVASASFDRSVKLWNGIIGKFVAAFSGHVRPVYQISWSADSRLLLSGSKDYPEDLGYWHEKLKQDLPGHADEVFAVDWNPDGENVASGGKDKVLKLWMG
ncbi:notchless protein homolog isoform X2 [Eucalyptus grandis]|uniref:notchless protein homolog isoform X2 n=1 Tax=Eucalyptus grandis TaxID=71139 RepID=UPI00192E9548|nr:notchless protein homolog isoform X2 [Eucalyptus grandis]XP_039172589.1 notchless protein homolog isoform X2 [Eucalyptus grandis]